MTAPTGDARRYRFGPLEQRGVLLGVKANQLMVLGGFALVTVVLLTVGVVGILGAGLLLLGALAVAFSPIGNRRLLDWAPITVSYSARRLGRRLGWRSESAATGHRYRGEADPSDLVDLPPNAKGLTLLATGVDSGSGHEVDIGVVRDELVAGYIGVIKVAARSFALLDLADQERALSKWAAVLAGLARDSSPVTRVQWIERTVPDDGSALGRYLANERDELVPLDSLSVRSYIEVSDSAGPVTQEHELYVGVRIDPARAKRLVRQHGGGDEGACAVLVSELRTFVSRLTEAGLEVRGVLGPRALAAVIRLAFDPASRPRLAREAATQPELAGVAPHRAFGVAAEEGWAHYRTESAFHRTYWIAEWPRVEVGTHFLSPLLIQTQAHRAISVVMEPVSQSKAVRAVEAARLAEESDAVLRERHGFRLTARKQRQAAGVARREEELADGHADIRFSGYVTVSAPTLDALDGACAEIEQAASQAYLRLEPSTGRQSAEFFYTLPICRGLR